VVPLHIKANILEFETIGQGSSVNDRMNRIEGALVGLATGDALGAGYEFGPPVTGPVEMIGGGPFGWEPGEWTDDTQMAICIAENSSPATIDLTDVGDRFIEWADECNDIGNQTRAVLSQATAGDGLLQISLDHYRGNPRHSAGNGSLMRTGPVALPFLGDRDAIARVARDVSDLTHADPVCGEACVLWSTAVGTAIDSGKLPDVRDGLDLIPKSRRAHWISLIEQAESQTPGTFTPNGWVITAFQAAWSSITHTTPGPNHYFDGVTQAVRIGNDTDTVAAIAGTLLGAAYGASAIPMEWTSMLHGWPGYAVEDLKSLALQATGNPR
jgi:ADP-ribosyl-[dinitrogen reductase] hydrolase